MSCAAPTRVLCAEMSLRIGKTTHRSESPARYRAGGLEPVCHRFELGDRVFAAPVAPVDACHTLCRRHESADCFTCHCEICTSRRARGSQRRSGQRCGKGTRKRNAWNGRCERPQARRALRSRRTGGYGTVAGRIGKTTGRFGLLGEYWCGRCRRSATSSRRYAIGHTAYRSQPPVPFISPSPDAQSHDSMSATANARFATSGNSIEANMDAE